MPTFRKRAAAMSLRPAATNGELGLKQRLCLFHNTSMPAEEALALDVAQITAELLLEKGVKASNIAAAGLGPAALHAMGVREPTTLRSMGFTALYLADAVFASEANSAYGGPSVIDAFLISASDAVCIAGSDAVGILGVTTEQLMAVGAPAHTAMSCSVVTPRMPTASLPAMQTASEALIRKASMTLGPP